MNSRIITVRRIPAELHQKLRDVAHLQHLSMNQLCNNIIKDFLTSHEDNTQKTNSETTTNGRTRDQADVPNPGQWP